MSPVSAQSHSTLLRHESSYGVEIALPRVLSEEARTIKRAFDLVGAVVLAAFALPLAALLALAIRIDSPGSVFYSQTRLGRGRKLFRVWKFRTMLQNSDEVLRRHLAENPEAALEWELTHKLKHDPRITRVGRLLRRASLDELPQVFNIVAGDMSLVGPRPIVEDEISKYGSAFILYSQVKPGLTGLWQVSGRNDTSYRQRVELDSDYIRNWTPSADLAILWKTAAAVLGGRGAY